MHEITLHLNDEQFAKLAKHLHADGLTMHSDPSLLGASLANACGELMEREGCTEKSR